MIFGKIQERESVFTPSFFVFVFKESCRVQLLALSNIFILDTNTNT